MPHFMNQYVLRISSLSRYKYPAIIFTPSFIISPSPAIYNILIYDMHLCISRPERGALFCKRSNIENIISLQRRRRGRVVTTVLDLYFGGLEITPRPDRLLDLFSIVRRSNPRPGLHAGICTNPQKGAQCMNRMIDLSD